MALQLVSWLILFITLVMLKFIGGGIDYDSGPFNVIIPSGATNVSFYVSITDDKIHEGDENFILIINASSLSDDVTNFGRAVVTILNDDSETIVIVD